MRISICANRRTQVDICGMSGISLVVIRVVAVLLSIVVPTLAAYGLVVPCACAMEEATSVDSRCCGGGASSAPFSEPCDNCNCELTVASTAVEIDLLIPMGSELSEPDLPVVAVLALPIQSNFSTVVPHFFSSGLSPGSALSLKCVLLI